MRRGRGGRRRGFQNHNFCRFAQETEIALEKKTKKPLVRKYKKEDLHKSLSVRRRVVAVVRRQRVIRETQAEKTAQEACSCV